MARTTGRKSKSSSNDPYELLPERIAKSILSKGIGAVTKRLRRLSVMATYQMADAIDVKYERPKPRGARLSPPPADATMTGRRI